MNDHKQSEQQPAPTRARVSAPGRKPTQERPSDGMLVKLDDESLKKISNRIVSGVAGGLVIGAVCMLLLTSCLGAR